MTPSEELDRLRTGLQHPHIRERKQAIDRAGVLLAAGEDRDAILALLAAVARDDMASSVREQAQAILDAAARTPPGAKTGEAQHMFPVRCPRPRCAHVTYFDKRRVCGADGVVKRVVRRGGVVLDELLLACEKCGCEMTHAVDCEGYKK